MISYAPDTLLETAVLKAGRFALATDAAGREVVSVGHPRLPRVVLQQKADGLHGLMQVVGATGAHVFTATEGDEWQIEEADEHPDDCSSPAAAEEYLVMGLRPLQMDGRPVRVAVRRDVVRLFLLPWALSARSLRFGGTLHYVVTGTRGLVGDWQPVTDGRTGVVVGVPELWLGVLERHHRSEVGLALRCDVPVPWIGDDGIRDAAPTTVGVFERHDEGGIGFGGLGASDGGTGETWLSTLPVAMTEGDVVRPVSVPDDVTVGEVPDGPWEQEALGTDDFSMTNLT